MPALEQVAITIDSPKTKGVEKALGSLAPKAMTQCIAPAVRTAAKDLAYAITLRVPNRTGTMRQSVGTGAFHYYRDGAIAYQAAGVRRGFGRMIAAISSVQAGKETSMRLKRMSKAATKQRTGTLYEDPAKIAHILEGGRKAIATRKGKALFNPLTGQFFRSAAAVPGKHFIQQAEQSGIAQATLQIGVQGVSKIFDDALKGK